MDQPPMKCEECSQKFQSYSLRFYCCNSDYQCCIICNSNKCKKCGKKRKNKFQPTSCQICFKGYHQALIFYQFKSDKNFCCFCLQKALKTSNSSVLILKEGIFTNSICDRQEAELFIRNFCFRCLKKLSPQENASYEKVKKVQTIKCQKCKHEKQQQPEKEQENKKSSPRRGNRESIRNKNSSAFDTDYFKNSTKCSSCGYSIYGNKGFITDDFSICESCAKFSCYEEDKMTKDNPSFMKSTIVQQNDDDEWQRKDDKYWRKQMSKEEDIMIENNENQKMEQMDYENDEAYNKQYEYGDQNQNQDKIEDHEYEIKHKIQSDQPVIVQDEQYRSEVYSERKLNQGEKKEKDSKQVIVIKEQQKQVEKSEKPKQEIVQKQKNPVKQKKQLKLKKSSSFKILEKQKLIIQNEQIQIYICKECHYEVRPENIIEKMCRCCYIDSFDLKKNQEQNEYLKDKYGSNKKSSEEKTTYESSFKESNRSTRINLFEKNQSSSSHKSQLFHSDQKDEDSLHHRMFESDIRGGRRELCAICRIQPGWQNVDGVKICIQCKVKNKYRTHDRERFW